MNESTEEKKSHKYYVAGDIWFFHLNEYVFGHLDLSHCRNHSLVIRYLISCVENYQIWALILWSFERIFDWISSSFSLSLTRKNVSYVHLNRSLCIWLSSTHAFSYSMFNKIFKHSQTHFNIVHTHTHTYRNRCTHRNMRWENIFDHGLNSIRAMSKKRIELTSG